MFELKFLVGDRWHTVVATDETLQDLCMGPHVRQKADIEGKRPPQANGELKGLSLRWPGKVAPFSKAA